MNLITNLIFSGFHLLSPTYFKHPTIDLTCCCKNDFDSNIINICKYNKKNDDSCNFIKDQKIFKKIKKIRNKEFCKDIKTIATLDEQQKNKLQIARQILQEKSKLYNIHGSLIANKKDLENMIKENDKKLLLGWRYQIFGKYYISLTS